MTGEALGAVATLIAILSALSGAIGGWAILKWRVESDGKEIEDLKRATSTTASDVIRLQEKFQAHLNNMQDLKEALKAYAEKLDRRR